jgi:hypothetical protein
LEIPFPSLMSFPAAIRLRFLLAKLFALRLRNLGTPPGFAAPNSWRKLSFGALDASNAIGAQRRRRAKNDHSTFDFKRLSS